MLKLFRKKRADPRKELRDLLGDWELPAFRAVVSTALERVRDDDASNREIADLVSSDPGLSVRLLGTVNSAAFALRHRVRNLHHAVSLLGRSQLESMLISIAVREALPSRAMPGFIPRRFWLTAARRATTARSLAEQIHPSTRSECFTASLLQDLAVPLLSQHRGEAYGSILERWHAGEDDLARLEREAFGWDHAEVGGWICRAWGFPEPLSDSIESHHADDAVESDEVAPPDGLLAARLVSVLREVDEHDSVERLVSDAESRCGITRDAVAELVRSSFETADEVARLFG